MAANHTLNYGLSQWIGTDAFSRLDFNADNLALDTAIKALADAVGAAPWANIASVKAQANTMSLTLDVSEVDFSEYLYTQLVVDLMVTPISSTSQYLRVNGVGTDSYLVTTNGGSSTATCGYFLCSTIQQVYAKSRVVTLSPYDATAYVSGTYPVFDGSSGVGLAAATATAVTWASLQSFNYTAVNESVPIKAGSGLYLLGVRRP